jgi:hypothetical protein
MNNNAFTVRLNYRTASLITKVGVSIPINSSEPIPINHPAILNSEALWDTGATNSVITSSTARKLIIQPMGITRIIHGRGTSLANLYLLNIYLQNDIVIQNIRVTEAPDTIGNFGVIIGMDIIKLGDLAITNYKNQTTFTFRMPSVEEIDFTKNSDRSRPVTT